MGQLAGHVRGWGGPAPRSLDPVSAPAVGRGSWLEESEGPALPPEVPPAPACLPCRL